MDCRILPKFDVAAFQEIEVAESNGNVLNFGQTHGNRSFCARVVKIWPQMLINAH